MTHALSLIVIRVPTRESIAVAQQRRNPSILSVDDKLQPLFCQLWIHAIDSRGISIWFTAYADCSAVGRNRFIAPFLLDLIGLPLRRRNKAIAPYDRWSRCLIFRRVQKCST